MSTDAVQERQLISSPTASPRLVERGPYLWDVRIDGRRERWELGYAYGKFPVGMGEQFVYRGQEYILQRAWYSVLDVALEARTTKRPRQRKYKRWRGCGDGSGPGTPSATSSAPLPLAALAQRARGAGH